MKWIPKTVLISSILFRPHASFSTEKANVELLQPSVLSSLSVQATLTLHDLSSTLKVENNMLRRERKVDQKIEKVENTRDKALCRALDVRNENKQALKDRFLPIFGARYKRSLSIVEKLYEEERVETLKLAASEIERLNKKKIEHALTSEQLAALREREKLRQERLKIRRYMHEVLTAPIS